MTKPTEEGLSVNGAEGLGGHGEGFEVQNQGVTRRAPGEGPKVSGGRSQSQELDSYDQPQYEAEQKLGEMFGLDEDAVKDMKRAVGHMEFTRDRLKKSSEKEKGEHPWLSGKEAERVAHDHLRAGKKEGVAPPHMAEVFRRGR